MGQRLDREVGALLAREAAAQDQQRLVGRARDPRRRRREALEVDPEGHVQRGGADALELLCGIPGRGHDGVEALDRAGVVPVDHRAPARRAEGGEGGQDPGELLVQEDGGGDADRAGPRSEGAQRQSVRDLEPVGLQGRERLTHRRETREGTVAAGPGHGGAGELDVPAPVGRRLASGFPGGDEDELVPGGEVAATEGTHGGADATTVGGIRVRDVDDTHQVRRALTERTAS